MTQEIQVAFEKFCDDYKLNFKNQIELIDFFKAGIAYANWVDNLPEAVVPFEFDKPEKMPNPTEVGWYLVEHAPKMGRNNEGPRYFDGEHWYRRGSELIDMGDEMCIVGRPYVWREM